MKEIYQAFRSAGVGEMEAIKVTDSFSNIINRIEKESAESKSRFEKESAVNRIIMGLTLTSIIGLITAFLTTA